MPFQIKPGPKKQAYKSFAAWFARLAVGTVFTLNASCALLFIIDPGAYAPSFELTGVSGEVMVRGMGILFLMWNATYPPVILWPQAQRTLFAVVLIQQTIGLVGETWLWLRLPSGHPALAAAGLRFIVSDGIGWVLMSVAYVFLRLSGRPVRVE